MLIKPLINLENFIMPTKGDPFAAGWDIYMPEAGEVSGHTKFIDLGFATEIPQGWCALLMPRSSVGAKLGLELNNTIGLIDSSYRGEWRAAMRTKSGIPFKWTQGERVLQFVLLPHYVAGIQLVRDISTTERDKGGFGSSGK